jgi:hypothetical protein
VSRVWHTWRPDLFVAGHIGFVEIPDVIDIGSGQLRQPTKYVQGKRVGGTPVYVFRPDLYLKLRWKQQPLVSEILFRFGCARPIDQQALEQLVCDLHGFRNAKPLSRGALADLLYTLRVTDLKQVLSLLDRPASATMHRIPAA